MSIKFSFKQYLNSIQKQPCRIGLYLLASVLLLTLQVLPALAAPKAELAEEKDFGFQMADRGFTALATSDGGYVVAGETLSYYMHGSGGYDGYLVKIDEKGYIKWQKEYGKRNDERIVAVQSTQDGGYIMTGFSHSAPWRSDKNIFLVKTNAEGTEEWSKIIGETGEDAGNAVIATSEGGYLVCGETNSSGAGDQDLYLVKTTDSGKVEWSKTFGGISKDIGKQVQSMPDGGYLVAGQTNSFGAGNTDIYLLRLNNKGDKVWEKTFGGSGQETVNALYLTMDAHILVSGATSSYHQNSQAYLVKVDGAGNKLWEKIYTPSDVSTVQSVSAAPDGHYWLAGWASTKGQAGFDFWLAKVDSNGKQVWEKKLAHSKFVDERFDIQPIDCGYLITGWWADFMKWSKTRNTDDVNVFTVKIDVS